MFTFNNAISKPYLVTCIFSISLSSATFMSTSVFAKETNAEESNKASDVEVIMVTALKRPGNLYESADAISALNGDDLERIGASKLGELGKFVPNFSYTENFGISQIFIRGVGNSFFGPGGDPGVAMYSDGVYLSDQEATGVALFDIEQVEVLRGPQGALYGRNATGGAVSMTSRRPEEDFAGNVGVTVGDFGRLELEGGVTGEISDGVRGRFSARHRKLDGFANNTAAQGPDPLDGEKSTVVRAQLEIDIAGGELSLIANYLDQDDVGPGLKVLSDSYPQPAEILFGERPSDDARDYASEVSTNTREVSSLTANWSGDVPLGNLTLVADHRSSDRLITYDQDGTAANQSVTSLDTESDQSYFETYLASSETDAYSWLVGATYTDFNQSRTTSVDGFIPAALIDPSFPLIMPFPFSFAGGGDLESTSWAVYGEGSIALSSNLDLRAGIRHNDDKKKVDEFLTFFDAQAGSQSESWSEQSGNIGIEYTPTDLTLLYAKVAKGFKAGALNLGAFTPSVDPETIINYEIGTKIRDIGGMADIAATAFTAKYSDLQVVQIGPLSQLLSNAAEASISGVELEAKLRPAEGVDIAATLSWMDASFDSFSSTDSRRGFELFDLVNNKIPMTSEWQFSLLSSKAWLLEQGSEVTLSAQMSYRSEYYFTEFNTQDARQEAATQVDLSLDWLSADEMWRVNVFARNLTDEEVISSMAIVSPLLGSVRVVSLVPPRHFGISFNYYFQ